MEGRHSSKQLGQKAEYHTLTTQKVPSRLEVGRGCEPSKSTPSVALPPLRLYLLKTLHPPRTAPPTGNCVQAHKAVGNTSYPDPRWPQFKRFKAVLSCPVRLKLLSLIAARK